MTDPEKAHAAEPEDQRTWPRGTRVTLYVNETTTWHGAIIRQLNVDETEVLWDHDIENADTVFPPALRREEPGRWRSLASSAIQSPAQAGLLRHFEVPEERGREHCKLCGVRVWAGQMKSSLIGGGIIHQDREYPYRPRSEVPEPTVEEWAERARAAREKAIAKGYTPEHDAQHGIRHLLNWAIDYARRGRGEDSSGLMMAAMELATIASDELGRLRHVADTMSAVSEALRTRYASDSQAAYFMRQIDAALEAVPEPQGEPSDAQHHAGHDRSCVCWRRRSCGCYLWDQDCPTYSNPTSKDRQALIVRLQSVIARAVDDSRSIESQMAIGPEEHAASERDQQEAEAVRDAVITVLRSLPDLRGEPSDTRVRVAWRAFDECEHEGSHAAMRAALRAAAEVE